MCPDAASVPPIVARDVSKSFRLRSRPRDLKSTLLHPSRSRRLEGELLWALRGVSLEVQCGECVGVIGRNGSGKSTLLRLLAGISRPTTGNIEVEGRVSALLELGAGFHDQISGRDNALLNAVLLGLSLREARASLNEIIAFAGLKDFIDEPMRTYSYGMYLRLGFSVAVHVRAEVLLLDEVLAVGDAEFQTKCFEHIQRLRRQGTTIVMVSHDLDAIERLADRVVLLDGGQIVEAGQPRDVVERYRVEFSAR